MLKYITYCVVIPSIMRNIGEREVRFRFLGGIIPGIIPACDISSRNVLLPCGNLTKSTVASLGYRPKCGVLVDCDRPGINLDSRCLGTGSIQSVLD